MPNFPVMLGGVNNALRSSFRRRAPNGGRFAMTAITLLIQFVALINRIVCGLSFVLIINLFIVSQLGEWCSWWNTWGKGKEPAWWCTPWDDVFNDPLTLTVVLQLVLPLVLGFLTGLYFDRRFVGFQKLIPAIFCIVAVVVYLFLLGELP